MQAPLVRDLARNIDNVRGIFNKCTDFVLRMIPSAGGYEAAVVYLDGLIKTEELQDHTLQPLLSRHLNSEAELENSQISTASTVGEVADAVLNGEAALLIGNQPYAVIINVRGGSRRAVEEPPTETTIRGPREGFTENLQTNTALIRFRLKTTKLKMVSFTIGEETKTTVILAYHDKLADPEVIQEVTRRLKSIKIDGVMESGYIEELIEDNPYSPYPQLHYTERPDTAVAHMLEGKFCILVDNTPVVLVGPTTFWLLMQASEDYYERFYISNLLRWLRYVFMFIALYLPSIYIAVLTYHHDMLPTNLLYSVASAREAIPFPALVEALIMEVSFEALREAGIRLPKTIGQAVGILGALVIGQAAVQAGIVSAPMVIIVALTGIASFTIPRFNLAITVRMLRFPLMIAASVLGVFGVMIGTYIIASHLCQLRSFGVPYMSGYAPLRRKELKDIFVRAPWRKMKTKPLTYSGTAGGRRFRRQDET
ncbi:spore germination protein [Paenibacillus tarimensis]|uniref:spore germination protein n=1 Tax=Paenibacillus tarimensis TaxID=416012 RepID=UPI001F439FDB|nr:spore germination protein [Paenibacillus tarimensis]MCF2946092.1 spore germination protein [Paenibacillus tarimensis]